MNEVTDAKDLMAQRRRRMVEWVKAELSGANLKQSQKYVGLPSDRYVIGVLFPIGARMGIDPAYDATDATDETATDVIFTQEYKNQTAESVKQVRYVPPSSVGFSFFVADKVWQIQVMASAKRFVDVDNETGGQNRDEQGRYVKNTYQLDCLSLSMDSIVIRHDDAQKNHHIFTTHDNNRQRCLGCINIRTTPHAHGTIVTVSLVNTQQLGDDESDDKKQNTETKSYHKKEQTLKTLFDVKLSCVIDLGVVGDYPDVDHALLSQSEQEIQLQYRHKKVYAVGHGAAAHWTLKNGQVHEIMSDFMPIQEVPQVTADINDESIKNVLSMAFLQKTHTNTQMVCQELKEFVGRYRQWINTQIHELKGIDAQNKSAGERLVSAMTTACERMYAGIELIESDEMVATAFAYANRAMDMQMTHSTKSWRAFQLAFILTALKSTTLECDDFRDVVDLIWFPTGGGKTEAYLGLTAYQILYRRLKYPDSGAGTTVLMRYTLKLLTVQQFLRATRLICALELIRKGDAMFGQEPISIGLWVGQSSSPNTLKDAQERLQKARQKNEYSSLIITQCPWCHTTFDHQNFHTDGSSFYITCHNKACDYGKHDTKLPCQIVDEMLYQTPPTVLLATIDKCAMFAWHESSSAFFGCAKNRPPELIIQDELHLIANALGSVAGMYESALQTVISAKGVHPKYVASTATIKEAKNQVQRLFAKDLAIFPPQGLSADDAFFAKEVPLDVRAGRLYVGYFAPILSRRKALTPLASLLMIAPFVQFGYSQQEYTDWVDSWWTQVVYHGSLKAVGNSHQAFLSDVKSYYQDYANEFFGYDDNMRLGAKDKLAELGFDENFFNDVVAKDIQGRQSAVIKQLTSNNTDSDNTRIFGQLAKDRNDPESVSVVLATNMVATGLDVSRLALMIMNGQPITTAEYIQASSRVGRGDVAGIVFANYYKDQARSLSHYENFYPYHQSFYRHVEPTSITPYTHQARRRALHAGLIIAVRHGVLSMLGNDKAHTFRAKDTNIKEIIDIYKGFCCQADPDRADAIVRHIDDLCQEWQGHAQRLSTRRFSPRLYYKAQDGTGRSLMYVHGQDERGLWATLQSMRNVEDTGVLGIL